jgi:ribosomal protein S6
MPSYELNFLIRRMAKNDLVKILKNVGETLLNNQGVLRKIEFLGHRKLPMKMSNKSAPHSKNLQQASYFVYHCDMPAVLTDQLTTDFRLDPDIQKIRFLRKEVKIPSDYVCTLEEELQPPPFRKSVAALIAEGRKAKKAYDIGTDEM